MKILGISGSTRKESLNTKLLHYIKNQLVKTYPDIEMNILTVAEVPLFNQDLEQNLPESVQNLIDKAAESTAFIISTPEYNNMVPGAVKNLLEWLSRKNARHAIHGKYVGICGASDGGFGTARAQNELLLLCTLLRFKTHADLRLPISFADKVLDAGGNITDPVYVERVASFLEKLVTAIR